MGPHGAAGPGGPGFALKIAMPFSGPAHPSVTAGLGIGLMHRGFVMTLNMQAGLVALAAAHSGNAQCIFIAMNKRK
ncbi:MAG: hypothetical protein EXR03_08660 [Pseudolabrys sp.]|nr:hypothetical protein [Pseudolabrys sp.]MSP32875.1 hypothetical protein [Pseudolabrys sp.]